MHDGQTQTSLHEGAETTTPSTLRSDLIVFADVGFALLPQRQVIYIAIAAITAFFYDSRVAIICFLLVQLSEVMDLRLFRNILSLRQRPNADLTSIMRKLYFNTAFSAGTISLFALAIADQQGATTHFMPLFVLLAAALFAAMHNHQLQGVLAVRLVVYSAAFLFIPARDLWIYRPQFNSDLWLQMFVSLIVLFFTLETARGHRKLYRQSMKHFDDLVVEHERAKQALKAKAEFLAVVSHELRTPLTSIKGSLDMVSSGVMGPVPASMMPALDIAVRNSTRLSTLINDILDYQKIDSDKMEYHLEQVDVQDLVAEATNSVRPMAEAERIVIDQHALDRPAQINVDRGRIEQVLVNLLSNAIKFSDPGGQVVVNTEVKDDRVRISVSDQGMGLPDDAGEKIFQPFSQLDSSATRQKGGTGLGLSISKQIVDAHHGQIDFVRNADKGTTFFVELNVVPSA